MKDKLFAARLVPTNFQCLEEHSRHCVSLLKSVEKHPYINTRAAPGDDVLCLGHVCYQRRPSEVTELFPWEAVHTQTCSRDTVSTNMPINS